MHTPYVLSPRQVAKKKNNKSLGNAEFLILKLKHSLLNFPAPSKISLLKHFQILVVDKLHFH